MMVGVVREGEIRLTLKVRGPRRREREIEVIVDTGYTGALTLSPAIITALGLSWQGFGRGILADGSECSFDVYETSVVWDGRARRVLVDEANADPLVGMKLLDGFELKAQIREGGRVTIKRLPSRRRRR